MPAASVNTSAATSIVVVPSPEGVNVAVYTVVLLAVKLDKDPPDTVISDSTKSVVTSLAVNVRAIELSFDVSPLDTVEEAIVMVGGVVS